MVRAVPDRRALGCGAAKNTGASGRGRCGACRTVLPVSRAGATEFLATLNGSPEARRPSMARREASSRGLFEAGPVTDGPDLGSRGVGATALIRACAGQVRILCGSPAAVRSIRLRARPGESCQNPRSDAAARHRGRFRAAARYGCVRGIGRQGQRTCVERRVWPSLSWDGPTGRSSTVHPAGSLMGSRTPRPPVR